MRQRETERQRDRETERQRDRETERQRDRYSATAVHGGQYTMRQREREIEIDYEVVHRNTDWLGRL